MVLDATTEYPNFKAWFEKDILLDGLGKNSFYEESEEKVMRKANEKGSEGKSCTGVQFVCDALKGYCRYNDPLKMRKDLESFLNVMENKIVKFDNRLKEDMSGVVICGIFNNLIFEIQVLFSEAPLITNTSLNNLYYEISRTNDLEEMGINMEGIATRRIQELISKKATS